MRDAKVKETEAQRIARLRAVRKAEDISHINRTFDWFHPFLPVKLVDSRSTKYPDTHGVILPNDLTTVIIGNMFEAGSLARGKVQKFNSVEELADVWTVD